MNQESLPLNYWDLRKHINVDTDIQREYNVSLYSGVYDGYITDDKDRIEIPEYHDLGALDKTYEFLRAQYFVDMVSRQMLYIWYRNDAKSELKEFFEHELLFFTDSIYAVEFNHHEDSCDNSIMLKIRMNRHELYVNEIVELLGLFPDEFEYNKDRHSICLNINVDRMLENDKKLRKISYE